MPVRMDQDSDRGSNRDNYPGRRRPTRGGGGGGANPLIYLLPIIFKLFRKKPKLMIGLLIVGGLFYFFGGGSSLFSPSNTNTSSSGGYATGFQPNQQKYDQAEVYEPLADNVKNPMPEKISLLKYAPTRLNQGQQGSCVGWASSYAARTILHSRATGHNPNSVRFSPSYLYNQIALKGCQGSYLKDAMQNMAQGGVLPLDKFAYDEQQCNKKPQGYHRQEASQFKIKGYNRLTKSGDEYQVDLLAVKQNLAQGAPVVIGMMVGGSFMQAMQGKNVWYPSQGDYNQRGFGGHAMCVIGYDDYLEGGAFQIMNSWGEEWGKRGTAYVRYKDFDYFVKEAYGLYPMGDANKPTSSRLNAKIGLVVNNDKSYISLGKRSNSVFVTTQTLRKGTKFKMEITNSNACYVYIFGQETDGSSYVLFPYTKKHSPYCGITGTRLFPRDFSMRLDDVGSKDYIAVVLSKNPIDYNNMNRKISSARGGDYSSKLQQVIKNTSSTQINSGKQLSISTDFKRTNMLGLVVEINKN
ncbi:MAG: C1 family peptidase [Cyclobacteriaceae bacterium]